MIFILVNKWCAIAFASPFYFAQPFFLFFALSIIFFAHFQQKMNKDLLENEQGRTRGEGEGQNSGILSERTF